VPDIASRRVTLPEAAAPLIAPPSTAHGVRALGVSDIPALLALAREAIPDTMAARLGPRFAERYHRALLDEPDLHLDGYFDGDELLGFIVYTHDVREALRSAFRRHALTFGSALLFALLSPARLAFVLRIAGSVLGRLPEPGMEIRAELLTIAVRRGARGDGALRRARGINVPHALISRAFDYLRDRGATEAKVFCKPEAVDPAANGFVRKEGFALRGQVVRWGILTNLYVKPLAPLPAGERPAEGDA
jgi:ribosomal protein S18 acetylase RimI-like enzyme